jgi:hypothetical protein
MSAYTPPAFTGSRTRRLISAAILVTMGLALSTGLATAQDNDQTYTEKILEFTTEPFFLTPYVDHLPASESVPTPLDVLGHIVGAADVLSYPAEIYEYMRAVAAASPRVEVFSMGTTEEGREMILVVVADEETLANLQEYKQMLAALGDPRVTNEESAEQLIATAKPIYWATGSIHSGETGSPEMLMELVYRLAVEESDFIREIRDNMIVMVTPVIEVDGRAKQVDVAMARRKDPDAVVPSRLLYWGKYVSHDNNRDGISLSLKLSQNVARTFLEYRPTVFHDLHESASYLYTSTGRGPYNAWVDPILIDEWANIAYQEVREMTALGVPGVYTHDFYDGWAPNYMFWVANMHNAIGRFYETQGAGDASTRVVRTNVERQWSRPNTPLPEVMWSIRNNVNMQESTLLIAMNYVARNREQFLRNYYRKNQRSVAKATAEGPAAYLFPASDPKPGQQARLLHLLQRHGIEVHRADRGFTADDVEYGAGSYIVRMDQPFSRAADMLLDKQYYNPNDPSPYDDVGWTLGPLYDVQSVRVEDPEVLAERMTLVSEPITAPGGIEHPSRSVFLVRYNADNNLAAFRFAHPGLQIEAAEQSFTVDDIDFDAGSFIIRAEQNPGNIADTLERAGTEYGFFAYGVSSAPQVTTHPAVTPRVAIMHTWSTTQTEGWLRLGMDEYAIPYEYISVHEARDDPNLIDKYDVIIMGPSSANALSLLRGVSGSQPIPWKSTDLTPNLGYNDETDDMRGGLELQGVLNLSKFVEAGGTFITIANSSSLPIHFGLAQGYAIKDTPELWARGGVFRAVLRDKTSPLIYGYGDELGVYFNSAPVFQRASSGFGRFGGFGGFGRGEPGDTGGPGSTTARRTGRGGSDEEDIVQGRPRDLGEAEVEEFQRENRGEASPRRGGAAPTANARTVLAFATDEEDLLVSGGLMHGDEMAGAPALVDVSLGDGHVIMFSFNPFWRSETLGSYSLVFNALMHHGNLSPVSTEEETTPDSPEGSR